MMQESKDEVEIDVKLKMRQDEKLEQTGFNRESINPLLINNVKKSGCPIPEQLLNHIIPIIHDNKFDVMACSKTESGHTPHYIRIARFSKIFFPLEKIFGGQDRTPSNDT